DAARARRSAPSTRAPCRRRPRTRRRPPQAARSARSCRPAAPRRRTAARARRAARARFRTAVVPGRCAARTDVQLPAVVLAALDDLRDLDVVVVEDLAQQED